MATAAENRRKREDFLVALYEVTDDFGPFQGPMAAAVLERAGLAEADGLRIRVQLTESGLIEGVSLAGDVKLTAAGLKEAERIAERREAEQELAISATILPAERSSIEPVLHLLISFTESAEVAALDDEDRADLAAQTQTIQAQMLSPRPRRAIVAEALRSARVVAEQAAGGAIGSALVIAVSELVKRIGG